MPEAWHPEARDSRRASSSSTSTSTPRLRPSAQGSILRSPPIAASMIHTQAALRHRSQPSLRARLDHQASDLMSLTRQQHAIEENLQALLDAQADALLAGLNGPFDSSNPSAYGQQQQQQPPNGSSTFHSLAPPAIIPHSSKATPVRQPPPTQPSTLRATRRAIWDSMRSLASLKAVESASLAVEADSSAVTLAQLDTWSTKRAGLATSIAAEVEAADQGARTTSELRAEQTTLDEQIAVVEAQLEELRSNRRAVSNELRSIENRVQARLSSFRGALAQVEREVETFLRSSSKSSSLAGPHDGSPGIRLTSGTEVCTLEEAREEIETSRKAIENQKADAESEREALDEGAIMWNDVVGVVATFERALGRELRKLRTASSAHQKDDQPDSHNADVPPDELIALMDDTIELVESNMHMAESKGWNLLVVAVGAEHEALCHGRAILLQALNWHARSTSPAVERGMNARNDAQDSHGQEGKEPGEEDAWPANNDVEDHADSIADTSMKGSRTISPTKRPRPHQDDPDPDLLLSR